MAKCRNSFVSNSSSSSFVIALPKGTELTGESIHQAMFGDEFKVFPLEYDWHNSEDQITSAFVVDYILDALKRPNSKVYQEEYDAQPTLVTSVEDLASWIGPGKYEPPFRSSEYRMTEEEWREYNKKYMEARTKNATKIWNKIKDKVVICIDVGDDYPRGSELEHGPALHDNKCVVHVESNH